MAARGPQNGRRVYPLVLARSRQLSVNKFFDPSALSMRKVYDGEKKEKKKQKIMSFLVATNVVANRPPERRMLMPKNTAKRHVHSSICMSCKDSFLRFSFFQVMIIFKVIIIESSLYLWAPSFCRSSS